MKEGKLKGTFFVLICVILWGLIPVVAKLGQTTLDNHQFLFYSSLVSFITLSLLSVNKNLANQFKSITFKNLLNYIFLGLLGTYIYYLFLYLGYSKTNGMEVLVFQYTWPILIVFLSIFILKEKLTIKKLSSITLGFLGVLFVLTKGSLNSIKLENPNIILLVFAGAFCFALFSVLSKNIKHDPMVVTAIYFLASTIASFISMLYFSEITIPTTKDLIPILINGIFVNGLSYVFWLIALKNAEASYLALFTFLTPIFSAFYLILFFNEQLIPAYIYGLILIIVGGVINSIKA